MQQQTIIDTNSFYLSKEKRLSSHIFTKSVTSFVFIVKLAATKEASTETGGRVGA
jgi:hypothetical protein